MSPTLHIQLLGDFRLRYGDAPVAGVSTPRLQALLAYLALRCGAPQPRQRMAFLFWPDSTEAQARTNLRHLLHQLSRALPDAEAFVQAEGPALQWRAGASFTLDVADFESALAEATSVAEPGAACRALERAAALYRGELLPGYYEDWVEPERERLRQAFESAIERLIDLLEQARDYDAAIGYARRLAQHDPLREAEQTAEGLATIAEALSALEQTEDRWCEAELYRIHGDLLIQHDATEAEAWLLRAIDAARMQQARSWELRATLSLTRLWRWQGRGAEAREILAAIYDWFGEGFDTPDLAEARALIEMLSTEGT